MTRDKLEAMLLPIVSDLNNMTRAIEEEGDRSYFGSTNDADRLREIAEQLDEWRFEQMSKQDTDDAVVERARKLIASYFDNEDAEYTPDEIRSGKADACILAALTKEDAVDEQR